jgi:hypothetical protein
MGRVYMNSCDFSLSTDDVENGWELKYFNIRRDEKYLLPFIKNAHNRDHITIWVKSIMLDPEAAQYVSAFIET